MCPLFMWCEIMGFPSNLDKWKYFIFLSCFSQLDTPHFRLVQARNKVTKYYQPTNPQFLFHPEIFMNCPMSFSILHHLDTSLWQTINNQKIIKLIVMLLKQKISSMRHIHHLQCRVASRIFKRLQQFPIFNSS